MNKKDQLINLVNSMILFEKDTSLKCEQILELVSPFSTVLTEPENFLRIQFSTLLNILHIISDFSSKIINIQSFSLNAIADYIFLVTDLPTIFIKLESEFPTLDDINKIQKQKKIRSLITILKEKHLDLFNIFHFHFNFSLNWFRFWTQILEITSSNDSNYTLYQDCWIKFKSIENNKILRTLLDNFSLELNSLKKIASEQHIFLPLESNFKWCVKGKIISELRPLETTIFLYEDRIIIFRSDKIIFSSSILHTWILKSVMYAEKENVLDILGIKYSFSFQTLNNFDKESFWKSWNSLPIWCPEDWSIFQPIINDPNQQDIFEYEI